MTYPPAGKSDKKVPHGVLKALRRYFYFILPKMNCSLIFRFAPLVAVCLASFAAMMCGCSRAGSRLDDIERLFTVDRVDSAIAMVDSFDARGLSRSELSRYTLLRARALGYRGRLREMGSDSALVDAAAYFRGRRDDERLSETLFWQMNMASDEASILRAIAAGVETEKIMEASGERAGLADVKSTMAGLYNVVGLDDRALESNRAAARLYAECGLDDRARGIACGLAAMMTNVNRDDEAIAVYDSLMARYRSDTAFVYQMIYSRLRALRSANRPERVRSGLDSLYHYDGKLYRPLCHEYEASLALDEGRTADARRHIDSSRTYNGDAAFGNPVGLCSLESQLMKQLGRYREAIAIDGKVNAHMKNSELKSMDVMEIVNGRLGQLHDEAVRERDREARRVYAIIFLSVLAVGACVATGVLIVRGKNRRIERVIDDMHAMAAEVRAAEVRVDSIVRRRFDSVNKLCNDYYDLAELKTDSHLKTAIYKNVCSQLDEVRGREFRKRLEEELDRYRDGIVGRLRSEMPGLDDDYVALFTYAASGFSVKAIAVITGVTKSGAYTRRRRLREMIEAASVPSGEDFLAALDMKS